MVDVLARFLLRCGTSTLWASVNPTLAAGEPAFETDTKMMCVGDGVTVYTSLPKFSSASAVGQSILTAADVAAVQTAIGASALGKTLLTAADAAAVRTAIGSVIGTDVQAHNANLAALAAIAGIEGDLIYRSATGWARLSKGIAGQVLAQNAGLTAPEWITKNGDVNLQVFTASGTYTPTAGYKKALVICTGGGRGGGSGPTGSNGPGGDGGATAITVIDISAATPSAVTIGAGGAGATSGASTGAPGSAGGTTSLASLCSATGGGVTYAVTGIFGIQGAAGANRDQDGNGGASFWGGGAPSTVVPTGASGETGQSATVYGSGGGGGAGGSGSGATKGAGGTGAAGVAFILEFK
jgi:hypothetical protein